MMAVASNSTRAVRGVSPATWTSVPAGRVVPKLSAWARHKRCIRHVHHIRHRPHDMAKFGASLDESVGNDAQNRPCLDVGVALQLGEPGRGAGNEHLISDADRTGIAVGLLERVRRRWFAWSFRCSR